MKLTLEKEEDKCFVTFGEKTYKKVSPASALRVEKIIENLGLRALLLEAMLDEGRIPTPLGWGVVKLSQPQVKVINLGRYFAIQADCGSRS